jgi:uncharacterized membrane protein
MQISKVLSKRFADAGLHEWLLLSSAFSVVLLLARMIVTGTIEYIFLPWNLFLAFIPYWITNGLRKNLPAGRHGISWMENKIKLAVVLFIWLLFIPNSFYIITDLFHFTHVRTAPKWFDLLLLFSFAWNGIVAGIISLRRVEVILSSSFGKKAPLPVLFIVIWLCAFGIYIGRFLRFNSWDIITNPFSLAGEIVSMLIHPFTNAYAWGMTVCYAAFITLLYFTIKKMGEAFLVSK